MSKPKKILVETLRIGVPLLLLFSAGSFLLFGEPNKKEDASKSSALERTLVETVPVETFQSTFSLEVDGITTPWREIAIGAEVSGRIVTKSAGCQTGRYVQKNEFLFQIDPVDYETEVVRLKQELLKKDSEIEELKLQSNSTEKLLTIATEDLKLQQSNLDRANVLLNKNAISQQSYDSTKQAYLKTRQSHQTLNSQKSLLSQQQSTLGLAKKLIAVQLQKANRDLERAKIKSPVSGIVTSLQAEAGDFVQRGQTLITLEDSWAIEVSCSLKMEDFKWILDQQGMESSKQTSSKRPVKGQSETEATTKVPSSIDPLKLPAVPATIIYQMGNRKYEWQGELSRFENAGLDEKTRMRRCRILVKHPLGNMGENPNQSTKETSPQNATKLPLVRGMFVRVQFQVKPTETLLSIPSAAIRPGNVVWVVRDGKLRTIAVRVARRIGKHILIYQESQRNTESLQKNNSNLESVSKQTEKESDPQKQSANAASLSTKDRLIVSPLSFIQDGLEVEEIHAKE